MFEWSPRGPFGCSSRRKTRPMGQPIRAAGYVGLEKMAIMVVMKDLAYRLESETVNRGDRSII